MRHPAWLRANCQACAAGRSDAVGQRLRHLAQKQGAVGGRDERGSEMANAVPSERVLAHQSVRAQGIGSKAQQVPELTHGRVARAAR